MIDINKAVKTIQKAGGKPEKAVFLPPHETAKQCGVTAERLAAIITRKDCPKPVVDSRGHYNVARVQKFVARIRRASAAVNAKRKAAREAHKALQLSSGRRKNGVRTLVQSGQGVQTESYQYSYRQYKEDFWSRNDRWKVLLCEHHSSNIDLVQEALLYGFRKLCKVR